MQNRRTHDNDMIYELYFQHKQNIWDDSAHGEIIPFLDRFQFIPIMIHHYYEPIPFIVLMEYLDENGKPIDGYVIQCTHIEIVAESNEYDEDPYLKAKFDDKKVISAIRDWLQPIIEMGRDFFDINHNERLSYYPYFPSTLQDIFNMLAFHDPTFIPFFLQTIQKKYRENRNADGSIIDNVVDDLRNDLRIDTEYNATDKIKTIELITDFMYGMKNLSPNRYKELISTLLSMEFPVEFYIRTLPYEILKSRYGFKPDYTEYYLKYRSTSVSEDPDAIDRLNENLLMDFDAHLRNPRRYQNLIAVLGGKFQDEAFTKRFLTLVKEKCMIGDNPDIPTMVKLIDPITQGGYSRLCHPYLCENIVSMNFPLKACCELLPYEMLKKHFINDREFETAIINSRKEYDWAKDPDAEKFPHFVDLFHSKDPNVISTLIYHQPSASKYPEYRELFSHPDVKVRCILASREDSVDFPEFNLLFQHGKKLTRDDVGVLRSIAKNPEAVKHPMYRTLFKEPPSVVAIVLLNIYAVCLPEYQEVVKSLQTDKFIRRLMRKGVAIEHMTEDLLFFKLHKLKAKEKLFQNQQRKREQKQQQRLQQQRLQQHDSKLPLNPETKQ